MSIIAERSRIAIILYLCYSVYEVASPMLVLKI